MYLSGALTQRMVALLLVTVWRELLPNTSCRNLRKSPQWMDKNCHSKCRLADHHTLDLNAGPFGRIYWDFNQLASAPESWSNYFFSSVSTFFDHFKPFLLISSLKSTKNFCTWTKKWYLWKKVFQPAFGCAQHPKAGRNTQQIS